MPADMQGIAVPGLPAPPANHGAMQEWNKLQRVLLQFTPGTD